MLSQASNVQSSVMNRSVKNLNQSPGKKLRIMRIKKRDGSTHSRRSDKFEKENIESVASSSFANGFRGGTGSETNRTNADGVH